jgi:hypothetical protein
MSAHFSISSDTPSVPAIRVEIKATFLKSVIDVRSCIFGSFSDSNPKFSGLGSNIDHGLFVGWVESAKLGFSAGGPTYVIATFLLSAKPNKMAAGLSIQMIL